MNSNDGNLLARPEDKAIPTTHYHFILIYCLLCFSFLCSSLVHAGKTDNQTENEVLAIGTTVVVKGNRALARKMAISQALKKGMETYLVRRLGSQGMVNNFQRLIRDIFPKAKEGIENFHVLAEDQIGKKYTVLLRLRVNEKLIDEEFREAELLMFEGPPIKVLFLVSEIGDGTVYYWWKEVDARSALSLTELALHNAFQKRGLSPINRRIGIPKTEGSEDLRSADLQVEDILKWGSLFSADIVIYGKAHRIDENTMALSLKAFDVDLGIQICEGKKVELVEKTLEDKEQAIETLERLGNHLATELTPAIIRSVMADQQKICHLMITIQNLENLRQFRAFRDFLRKDVKGVRSVRQTGARKNSISIVVEFQGHRNKFMDRVLNHQNLPFQIIYDQTEEGELLLDFD